MSRQQESLPNPRLRLPIVGGPLRGHWWLPGSGGKVLRFLTGSYEPPQTQAFCDSLRPGDVFLDIGAAQGYYTLLASRLVGKTGRVVAFEPNPGNAAMLRKHVAMNRLSQAMVNEMALGDENGVAHFGGGSGSGTNRLCDHGVLKVTIQRLDDFVAEHSLQPTHLKIDVEGAEVDVLRGGEETIRKLRPTIFLSTHGPGVHQQCCALLVDWGYQLAPIGFESIDTAPEVLAEAA